MLSLKEMQDKIAKLNGWDLDLNTLTKTYKFDDGAKVIIFINKVMEIAEEFNHHPQITINIFSVKIDLITHSENSITNKDFELAEVIDRLDQFPQN